MSGQRGPARDAPSAPLEKAGTRRAPTAALLGPLPRRPPLHRLASLCPRKPVSQPGPFGPNARPPPRLSRVKAGARARQLRGLLHLPASSRGSPRRCLPRGDVCPAPPPRPCPPPFRCGRSSAPGLHWPRRRPRGAGSSRLPQANRGAAGPYLCAHPGSQGVDGRVPEARAGVPARAAKENRVSARRTRPASPGEPGEATVRPGNFAGGLRSEKRKEQLVLSPLPPASSRQF